ncbi:MAG: 2OG-Fe(II) oxygenase [Cyclobacteriaceae bacterium]
MNLNFESTTISESLNTKGYAIVPSVLSALECQSLIENYQSDLYRTVINMQRYRFGRGEYKYFKYPLPDTVQTLRQELYKPLAPIANEWMKNLKIPDAFPLSHEAFIKKCHQQNQLRPTPLILKYEPGDYNTLHQDLYGAVYFPFQVIFILTQQGRDHEGGELVLTEQVPRAQSKAMVLKPNQGDAVIITTNFRPVLGTKGYYRANVRHGVSEITSGKRFTLGIVFHDAA